MKNKLCIISVLLVFLLSGCTVNTDEDNFNMKFNDLNQDNKTATFTVSGYPNDKEFDQIDDVITDSMKDYSSDEEYTISVYADEQEHKKDDKPFYGIVKYKDGKITQNDLKEPSEKEYNNL